jgi:hypothetical protein
MCDFKQIYDDFEKNFEQKEQKLPKNYPVPYYWLKHVNFEELNDYYNEIASKESTFTELSVNVDTSTFITLRRKIVDWLLYVSKNLNFKNETIFKCIQIFDLYMNKSQKSFPSSNQHLEEEFQLIAVICLSLSCKLEEINCNYMKFLNEKLLHNKYSISILIKRELEILRVLNFNLTVSNFYNFNNIFLQAAIQEICSKKFSILLHKQFNLNLNEMIFHLINLNEKVSKYFVTTKQFLFLTQKEAGFICFKTSLIALSHLMGQNLALLWDSINCTVNSLVQEELHFYNKVDRFPLEFYSHLIQHKKFCL